VATASSNHPGGAHVLMADGSSKFIIESIDCGNLFGGTIRLAMSGRLAPGQPSPFGVWGALGTRSMNDNQ
jgi:prepilin-type processing-associated H-X9-DG protein